MTKTLLDEMRIAVRDDCFFDFIANNYYKMEKEDLKQIIIEMDWFVYTQSPKMQREAERDVLSVLANEDED